MDLILNTDEKILEGRDNIRKAKEISEDRFKRLLYDVYLTMSQDDAVDYNEFVQDIFRYLDIWDLYSVTPEEDRYDIIFNLENFELEVSEYTNSMIDDSLIGITKVDNLMLLGGIGGGDWETPLFYMFYFDENEKIRLYAPRLGNPVNIETKSAIGSEGENPEIALNDIDFKKYEPYDGDPEWYMLVQEGYTLDQYRNGNMNMSSKHIKRDIRHTIEVLDE